MIISEEAQKLLAVYQYWNKSHQIKENVPTIHVDEVASKVAAFYEKIRGIIDWKEEHLLKRRAIERILKRRIFSKIALSEEGISGKYEFAEPLVLELIRGGHFPNDKIEESQIPVVQKAVDKYAYIIQRCQVKDNKIQFYSWLSEIAACEIEEILSPSVRQRALIDFMFSEMKQRITLSENLRNSFKVTEEEETIQIYIAVQRALFKLDSPVVSYHLIKYFFTDWKDIASEKLSQLALNIDSTYERIEKSLAHPLSDKYYQIAEKYDTPYLLLGDALSRASDPKVILTEPAELEKSITAAYNHRVKTLKGRLNRAAVYSTLSIFLTNIVSLFLIEIPFNKWITGYYFNMLAMVIDILVPTFLMYFMVATVKPPNKENLPRIIMEIIRILSGKKDIYEIKYARTKKGLAYWILVNSLYIIGFTVTLLAIVWSLSKVNFPPLSHVIFIIFLSLIAFAGAKIRQRSKELQVIEEKDSFIRFFIDPFSVPIIQLGKWFTLKWKKYNVIAVFFSALIDMPFTTFVEFIEQWRYFLKEKKEKIH